MPNLPVGVISPVLPPLPDPPGQWYRTSQLVLAATTTAPHCARLHTKVVLHGWSLEALVASVESVVSELVTNAVLASAMPDTTGADDSDLPLILVRLLSDGLRVVIEVWDRIPQLPVATATAVDDESGRGLVLVEALSARWGYSVVSDWVGKVVWSVVTDPELGYSDAETRQRTHAQLPRRVPQVIPGVQPVQAMNDLVVLKRVREGLQQLQ